MEFGPGAIVRMTRDPKELPYGLAGMTEGWVPEHIRAEWPQPRIYMSQTVCAMVGVYYNPTDGAGHTAQTDVDNAHEWARQAGMESEEEIERWVAFAGVKAYELTDSHIFRTGASALSLAFQSRLTLNGFEIDEILDRS